MSKLSTKARIGFGTAEWAEINRNCMIGCKLSCSYCYARANAINTGIVANRSAWVEEKVLNTEMARLHVKEDGLVMFPTRHDTTPSNIKYVLPYLTDILAAGNDVLYVTKAHLSCMQEVCEKLVDYKGQLTIRITIGSMHPSLCKFWERNAPSPQERLAALQCAFEAGYQTSVSMEPMLHGVEDAIETFQAVEPFVTEKIWLGAMNRIDSRVDKSNANFKAAVDDLKELQSRSELLRLHGILKDEPKVSWKESITKLLENEQEVGGL